MGDSPVMKEQEVAEGLGISRSSLRQMRMNGPRKNKMPFLPYIKIGRSVRYLKTDIEKWLLSYRVEE